MSEDPLRPDPRGRGSLPLRAVKANQPDLLEDVRLLFDEPPPGERFLTARQVDQHGGRLEVRQLRASATLAAYLRRRSQPIWDMTTIPAKSGHLT